MLRSIYSKVGVVDAEEYSGHSQRRGIPNWATADGWDTKSTMEDVGGKSIQSAMRYIDSSDRFARYRPTRHSRLTTLNNKTSIGKGVSMFKFQKLSNYGTSTPAVARTVLQAKPIIDVFNCKEEQRTALLEKLFDVQRHLLKCVECRDSLATEIEEERKRYAMPQDGDPRAKGAYTLPGVADLQSKGDTFLQSAKLAIAATGEMIEPFYGKGFAHKYHQYAVWAKEKFGAADTFTTSVEGAGPFVKRIVQMRNAVDHPRSEPGAPMVYANFDIELADGKPLLVAPRWSLTGEPLRPMLEDFDRVIESIITLGEQILINLFEKFRMAPMIVLAEIPVESRRADNPTRLMVTATGYPPA